MPRFQGPSIGRIAGVEVRLHWSWWIAVVVIAASLGTSVFPAAVGGLSDAAYASMAIVTTILFFASLVLHELGHALEARHEGIPTRGITLWALGGVAWSGMPFATPGAEARVAIAGPAVSAVLATVFVAAGQIGGITASVDAVLLWLGWTNALLLGFNLIPALPLDGGRVLRAFLWRLSGSLLKATRTASRVSHAVAVALIAIGLAGWVTGGIGGLWFVLIGWFVFGAASSERAGTEARAALGGVHVADVMTPDPVTIAPTASAADLLELRRRTGHSVFPVVDAQGLAIGLVPVLAAERLPERRRDWVVVQDLLPAGPPPLEFDADADVLSAVPALAGNPLHRAAVLRAGRLVGVLSMADITRAVRLRRPAAG